MTSTRLLAAAAASLAALVAGSGIATGQGPVARTLLLNATPAGGSGLDLGPKGVSVGDEFFEHGRLTGAARGRYQLVTQLVAGNGSHGTEQNEITVFLRDGTIAAAGAHGTKSRFSMPVAGGTGVYRGARGELAVAPGRHGRERLTITLDP